MTDLAVENVRKQLGNLHILQGVSFTANKGQIVALLGASGSGKTTLLRCIAGLDQPETGRIVIGGKTVLDDAAGVRLPPEERNIGLVFQSYALWPHRTVFENVAYGLRLRRTPEAEVKTRVSAILEKLGLGHLAERYPDQLSGGQQQRVAICRALVYEPKVLLLDEPLSNLDAKLREEARFWIRKLILDLGICAILVTHDQGEALAVADHILLLKGGVIAQEGTPFDIYGAPNTFYTADFMGTNNILSGRLDGETLSGKDWSLDGHWQDRAPPRDPAAVRGVLRVEAIRVTDQPAPDALQMDIEGAIYLGDRWEYRLRSGDLALRAHGDRKLGGKAFAIIPRDALWLFNP